MEVLNLNDTTIQKYYTDKKEEVREWLFQYISKLPRIKTDQKEKLTAYATSISITTAGEINDYVQSLPTISIKAKKQLNTYISNIEWLPKGVNVGYADGELINRVQSSAALDAVLAAAFSPIDEKENKK